MQIRCSLQPHYSSVSVRIHSLFFGLEYIYQDCGVASTLLGIRGSSWPTECEGRAWRHALISWCRRRCSFFAEKYREMFSRSSSQWWQCFHSFKAYVENLQEKILIHAGTCTTPTHLTRTDFQCIYLWKSMQCPHPICTTLSRAARSLEAGWRHRSFCRTRWRLQLLSTSSPLRGGGTAIMTRFMVIFTEIGRVFTKC